MPENHIDLRLLDPDDGPDADKAAELFVARVMAGVERQAGLYPRRADPLHAIWLLARPLVLAASIVLAVAATILVRARFDTARPPMTVAEAVGVPAVFLARTAGGPR